MRPENLTDLEIEKFRTTAPALAVRGSLHGAGQARRRDRLKIEPLRYQIGDPCVVMDMAIWQQLRDFVGDNGLDLSPQAGLSLARALLPLADAANEIIRMASFGRGLAIKKQHRGEQ